MIKTFLAAAPLLLLFLDSRLTAQTARIAAASDLQFVLEKVASEFKIAKGLSVEITYGSSGNLYAQIANGAPFDAFFSADITLPEKLETDGIGQSGSLYPYARGQIVLWTNNVSGLEPGQGMAALEEPTIQRIAIANPQHAPYGRAAVEAFRYFGIYERIQRKLVLGESVAQAAQFIDSGAAPIGVIALSLALSPALRKKGKFFVIPPHAYSPLRQGAILIASGKNLEIARQFLVYLKSPEVRKVFKDFGFLDP